MTGWAGFVGLTVVVLTALLVLARLSQTLVSDGTATGPGSRGRRFDDDAPRRNAATDPVIPRFESRSSPAAATYREIPELSTAALLANVALTQGVFGGIVLAGAFYFEVPLADLGVGATPLARGTAGVAVGVLFGVVLWVGNEAAGVVADAVGAGYDESLRQMLAPETPGGWLLLLVIILPTIAVVEELIFRAAAVGALSTGLGVSPWLLAVASSVAFGLAHGAQGRAGVVVTGALGFALAAGFVVTGSLLVVVVAHYLVNALELVVHEGLGLDRVSEHV